MLRLVVCTFVGASVIAALPHYASLFQERLADRRHAEAEAVAVSVQEAQASLAASRGKPDYTASYAAGRSIRLAADAQGHFTGDFRINGSPVSGLIDTGATYIALNVSTARRLGVHPAPADFSYSVSTANGQTRAAKVVLDNVQIGPIRVDKVDAFVLDDQNISVTLIGMSFMSKLESYQVERGELLLVN